jgi:hypothetical protein
MTGQAYSLNKEDTLDTLEKRGGRSQKEKLGKKGGLLI